MSMYETVTRIPVMWMMEWMLDEMKKEIDFRYEADMHEEASRQVRQMPDRKHIAIPELHAELCSKRMLVMECVEGCSILKLPEVFPDFDQKRDVPVLLEAVETFLGKQVLHFGKFHGDPHAGNIMVRRRQDAKQGECPFQAVIIDHG